MSIDLASFTPLRSLAGGLVIGLASALLYAGSGRIAGITGISAGLLPHAAREGRDWRFAFALGFLAVAAVVSRVAPAAFGAPSATLGTLIVAGLLVGAGTRLANGCTSGHGVCGLSRFSPRSLASVATFMLTAGITVVLTQSHALVKP